MDHAYTIYIYTTYTPGIARKHVEQDQQHGQHEGDVKDSGLGANRRTEDDWRTLA